MHEGRDWANPPVSNTAGSPVTSTDLVHPPADSFSTKTFAAVATMRPPPQLKTWLWYGWKTNCPTRISPPVRSSDAVEYEPDSAAPSQKLTICAVPPDIAISARLFAALSPLDSVYLAAPLSDLLTFSVCVLFIRREMRIFRRLEAEVAAEAEAAAAAVPAEAAP